MGSSVYAMFCHEKAALVGSEPRCWSSVGKYCCLQECGHHSKILGSDTMRPCELPPCCCQSAFPCHEDRLRAAV